MADFDIELFKQRLGETIVWCNARLDEADLENSLRTPPIPVNYNGVVSTGGIGEELKRLYDFAEQVYAKRHIEQALSDTGLAGGRLLLLYISRTLCDGIGPIESGGFFDNCNFPAWDTWIYLGEEQNDHWQRSTGNRVGILSYLVCWIPPKLSEFTQMTIEIIAEDCLQWVEDCEFELDILDDLRSAGLFIR